MSATFPKQPIVHFARAFLLTLATSVVLVRVASAAAIVVQNTSEFGTGAYAIATSRFALFDNTDSVGTNDGFGVLGRMNISDAAILSLYLAGDVASIRNAFEPFSTPFSLETTGLAGAFSESRSADTRASISTLGGSAVYLWIYKGSSITGATEHLIARLAAAFPTDPEIGSPQTASASLRPGGVANLVVGNFAAFTFDYGAGEALPGYSTVPVEAIPEPSTAIFLAVGASVLRRRIRL